MIIMLVRGFCQFLLKSHGHLISCGLVSKAASVVCCQGARRLLGLR